MKRCVLSTYGNELTKRPSSRSHCTTAVWLTLSPSNVDRALCAPTTNQNSIHQAVRFIRGEKISRTSVPHPNPNTARRKSIVFFASCAPTAASMNDLLNPPYSSQAQLVTRRRHPRTNPKNSTTSSSSAVSLKQGTLTSHLR